MLVFRRNSGWISIIVKTLGKQHTRTSIQFDTARYGVGVFLFLLAFASAVNVEAQVIGAILQGRVTNTSGAALPDVELTVKNTSTGFIRTVKSRTGGFFLLPDLPAGTYSVVASLAGFNTVSSELSIAIGEQRTINLQMSVGTQRVRPSESSGGIQNGTSAVAGVADSTTVRDLPSNGRDWTQAATLQAGVSAVKTQPDASNSNSGRGQRADSARRSAFLGIVRSRTITF